MNHFSRFLNAAVAVFTVIGCAFLLGAMLLMVSNIVTSTPLIRIGILQTYDGFKLMISVFVIIAMVYCTLHKGHVDIPIVFTRLPESVQRILVIIRPLLIIAVWGPIAWYSTEYAAKMWMLHETTTTSQLPVYPFRTFLALGAALLCLVTFLDFLISVKKGSRG